MRLCPYCHLFLDCTFPLYVLWNCPSCASGLSSNSISSVKPSIIWVNRCQLPYCRGVGLGQAQIPRTKCRAQQQGLAEGLRNVHQSSALEFPGLGAECQSQGANKVRSKHPLSGCRLPIVPSTWWKGPRGSVGSLFEEHSFQSWGLRPRGPNSLPKAPPSNLTLGIRIHTRVLRGEEHSAPSTFYAASNWWEQSTATH